MRDRFGRCALCLVMVLALVAGSLSAVNATTVKDAQKKEQQLKKKKQQTEAAKKELSEKLNNLAEKMAGTEKKMRKKAKEVQKAEDKLVQAKVRENNQFNSMKLRIRYIYEEGDFTMMAAVLEAQSMADLLNRVEYASEMSDYDRKMLLSYQKVVAANEKKEKKLKKQYKKLESLQDELSSEQQEVQSLLNEKNMELADLKKQLGDNAKQLKSLIAKAEAARKVREEQTQAQSGGSSGGSPGASKVVGTGQFTHPCPGTYLSSGFGYRSFDNSFHKGYDFASHGKSMPTYAAAAGTVIIAGWSSTAGNWIVINHGNGLVTKYMHHSKIYVSAGQKVKKGQNIGLSGTTGSSTGVHLHFQVEVDGVAVDPGKYLNL